MKTCPDCGGNLHGDGYTSVVRCEYVDEDKTDFVEPDAGPIYCGYTESDGGTE